MSTRALRTKPTIKLPRIIASVVALVLAVVWVFPVYWMVSSSLLPNVVLTSTKPRFFPYGGSFDNYGTVLSAGSTDGQWWTSNFARAMGISLSVTLISVFFAIVFAFLAALAISRFKFRGRKSFVLAILFIQMLPAEGLFIAQYKMMDSVGIATHNVVGLNSVIGISILYIAAVIPFTIWMLRGFVAGIPAELEESAQVDGCTSTGAFFRITFPLLAPGLVASGVYAFLQVWNEFTIALVILQKEEMRSLPLWLRTFIQGSQARETDWGAVMAASTLVAIPVIIFFLLVQGRLTSGLVAGAVKG